MEKSNELSSIYPSKDEHEYPLPQPRKEFQSSPNLERENESRCGEGEFMNAGAQRPHFRDILGSQVALGKRVLWGSTATPLVTGTHLQT